jgi:hypothetical protein
MTQNNVRDIRITDAGRLVVLFTVIDVTRHRLSSAKGEMSQIRGFVSGAG